MSTLQELKDKVELARNKAKSELSDKIEAAKLNAELFMLTNEALLNAQANQALREQATAKLEELELICKSIVEENPVRNNTTRTDRTWNPSRQYGLGNQISILTGLLSGIQYSVREHADLMLPATNLNKDLVESTLESFGSLPYYSNNYGMVIQGTPHNVPALLQNIGLIEQTLGIQLDKSKLTQSNMDSRYEIALAKAQRSAAETELTMATQQYVIK